MKLFQINRNSIALAFVFAITICFFIAGLFKVLDFFIVKTLLFIGFSGIVIVAFSFALKNDTKKNRPEDTLQDDSH